MVERCVFVVKDNVLIIEKLSDGRYMLFVDKHPIVFTFSQLKNSPSKKGDPWTWVKPPWSGSSHHQHEFFIELSEFKSLLRTFKKIFKEK
jgi:hypothetical protein